MSSKLTNTLNEIGEGFRTFQKNSDEKMDQMDERLGNLETMSDRPKSSYLSQEDSDKIEHCDKFKDWLRDPSAFSVKSALAEADQAMSQKAVTSGTNLTGGFAVPALIERDIEEQVRTMNPFRNLVKNVNVQSSSFTQVVSKNDTTSAWVAEAGTRSETTTSEMLSCAPSFGTLYSYPKASEESMQDIFFDVQQWLVDEVANGFASAEATAIWSGSGSNQPLGMKTTTPVTTADNASPERDQYALQYTALSGATSPYALVWNDLINVAYSLHEDFQINGSWVMNRTTAALVRKISDQNGQYLWQPSGIVGQPDTLLGFPVYQCGAVDTVSPGNFPIVFGDFRRGYLLADVGEPGSNMRITVDDNITTPGQVKFYVRKRMGGAVLNDQALKLLKYADS